MDKDLAKTQQYLEWLKEKLYLNNIAPSARKRTLRRGQVYECNLGIGIGSEECKKRPCVILQYNSANSSSPNTIVAPITHTSSTLPTVVSIADKSNSSGEVMLDGNVLLGNIVCVSKARLGNYITELTQSEMKQVNMAIAFSLGLNHNYQSLQNLCNDRQEYIEKLQNIRCQLKKDIASKQRELMAYQVLMDKYNLSNIQALEDFLEKYSIEQ